MTSGLTSTARHVEKSSAPLASRFTAQADESGVPIRLTMITDRQEKTKTVLLAKERQDYRVKIQSSGMRVRLRLESMERAGGWRIYGGILTSYSMDEA